MSCEYSDKEYALINYFFKVDKKVLEEIFNSPSSVYNVCCRAAFLTNEEDEIFTPSLRKVLVALDNCRIYRMTPEFEELIDDRVLENKNEI